jgi:hypothetical protein
VSPHVRTKYAEHSANPLIKFYFDGNGLNMGIRLALNHVKGGVYDQLERFNKFEKTGDAVLNFDTNTNMVPDVIDSHIYTFVKMRNELYRGSILVRSNVVRRLSIRSYSTKKGMDYLRRVLKVWK